MEHEPHLPASTHLALTLAGIAVVGIASCFSGGLALLALAGLFVYLAATSRPECDHHAEFTCPSSSGIASCEPSPEPAPCPSPVIGSAQRWQEAVAARRSVASGRCSSI